MRSFIITASIFILMLIVITLNSIYVRETTAEIYDLLYKDSTEELCELWEKNLPFLRLSVSYAELERVGELIAELKYYDTMNNSKEKERIRLLIRDAVSDIDRLERLEGRFNF
ncbi:MAG: hypothetical protein E7641_08830 [Ruminococcaceae bacterium]|nr:hypothetical protein [Oscillospiraceae bacterium]